MQNIPNLFIVGAPKCGTTALHWFLEAHKDIYMTKYKEPHFFASDLSAPQYVKSGKQYLSLFNNVANQNYKFYGESSPLYLYSKEAARNIAEFNPEAKIIITLRNPRHAIKSLHTALMANGKENITDLNEALSMEPLRHIGLHIPFYCYPKDSVFYKQIFNFLPQIKRYLEYFEKSNIMFIDHSNMYEEPQSVISNIYEFLGVSSAGGLNDSIPIRNEMKQVKSKLFQSMIMLAPYRLRKLLSLTVPERAKQKIRTANIAPTLPKSLEKNNMLNIEDAYVNFRLNNKDVKEIELLTGLNLPHWL